MRPSAEKLTPHATPGPGLLPELLGRARRTHGPETRCRARSLTGRGGWRANATFQNGRAAIGLPSKGRVKVTFPIWRPAIPQSMAKGSPAPGLAHSDRRLREIEQDRVLDAISQTEPDRLASAAIVKAPIAVLPRMSAATLVFHSSI